MNAIEKYREIKEGSHSTTIYVWGEANTSVCHLRFLDSIEDGAIRLNGNGVGNLKKDLLFAFLKSKGFEPSISGYILSQGAEPDSETCEYLTEWFTNLNFTDFIKELKKINPEATIIIDEAENINEMTLRGMAEALEGNYWLICGFGKPVKRMTFERFGNRIIIEPY